MFYESNRGSYLLFLLLTVGLITCFSNVSRAQHNGSPTEITGEVTGEENESLYLAHVMIKGSTMGDVTNQQGQYKFKVDTVGTVTVVASMVGYKSTEKKIDLSSGEVITLDFDLNVKSSSLGEAKVTANAFTTGAGEGVTLSPTEVVTTPGAAADIFRALKTFPGVSNIDEGSGLFVRGGNVNEVSFILGQASVVHPYKYETPTGGVFGTIPPFLVSGTHFSTGGFSAKYGNALSAVLAMESKGMPNNTSFNTNIGIGAFSAGGAVSIIPQKLGAHFSGNKSLTGFMFDLNGLADEFRETPRSKDGNLSIIAKPAHGTTIKLFNYLNTSKVGVRVPQPSFDAIFRGDDQNRLHNLQWKQLWDEWLIKTSVSVNNYKKDQRYGGLVLDEEDRTYKFRSDVEFTPGQKVSWYGGFEWIRRENNFLGEVPERKGILAPSAGFVSLDEKYATDYVGGYLETEYQLVPPLQLRLGVRADYEDSSAKGTIDPRFSVTYRVSNTSSFRLATGRYHQYAEPFQYNTVSGNKDLRPQEAWHYIAGYEYKKDLYHLRLEGYYKSYDELIIEGKKEELNNTGYGEAYGADVFFKYSDFMRTPFNGWISYSFLRSKRLYPRQLQQGVEYEYAPSAFDITHNLNVVGKAKIIGMLTGGITYRYSTGRPFTPVINARATSKNYYLPVEGAIHSERLPNFHRMDVNLSYYWVPMKDWSVIFYASVSNLLNHNNVMDYAYNNDYSKRKPVYSNYRRFVYAGATVNIKL
ncbi:TonB-dependent receptor [Fodinibius halophilus]|uniref:TonB-dependent receptor n=1 Tax=Fodinibius halophilus TaxID=1736908 RepID=A0A6M1T0N5_9BACT|nr:TonB-dependent receptor [Fodinibius halophilus]NGP89658.1 TonB-dependent receptor [Fodinibius halophilus]